MKRFLKNVPLKTWKESQFLEGHSSIAKINEKCLRTKCVQYKCIQSKKLATELVNRWFEIAIFLQNFRPGLENYNFQKSNFEAKVSEKVSKRT